MRPSNSTRLKIWNRSFRARFPSNSTSWRREKEAFVQRFRQMLRVEDVKTKFSCEASFEFHKLKMWKLSFLAALSWIAETRRNEYCLPYSILLFPNLFSFIPLCFSAFYSLLPCFALLCCTLSTLLWSTPPFSTFQTSSLLHHLKPCCTCQLDTWFCLWWWCSEHANWTHWSLFWADIVQHVPTWHNDHCFVLMMYSPWQLDTMIFTLWWSCSGGANWTQWPLFCIDHVQ